MKRKRTRSRGAKEKGTIAETEIEAILQGAGLGLQAWRSSTVVDKQGIDLHCVEVGDEEDRYKVDIQVKFSSSAQSGVVMYGSPYPGFQGYYSSKVHALVFVAEGWFFVYPFVGTGPTPDITLSPRCLKRKFGVFRDAFAKVNLAFDKATFPHYVKSLISSLKG
jgi:hypothetical protein